MNPVHPIILSVPDDKQTLSARDRVAYLGRHARRAVKHSARLSCVALDELPKDENGAPLPVHGVYWSLSHKSQYVAGVVDRTPVGIDVERVRACSEGLFRKVAGKDEWALVGTPSVDAFFRFWTAKEAVLKVTGVGIAGLSHCRIIEIRDKTHLSVAFRERIWPVEQLYFDGHIAAVVSRTRDVRWTVTMDPDG